MMSLGFQGPGAPGNSGESVLGHVGGGRAAKSRMSGPYFISNTQITVMKLC